MRLVVDSNKLRSTDLDVFLQARMSNFAVLTDFVAMEAYKGDTLIGIHKSLEIVSRYPSQVIVLKNSVHACKLSGRRKALQKRLIDKSQTTGFSLFVERLLMAKNGHLAYEEEILAKGHDADEHFTKMLNEAITMKPAMEELGREYSKMERRALRDKRDYTPDLAEKIITTVLEIAGWMYQDSPHVKSMPYSHELPNTYPFRYCLACYLLVLNRVSQGGVLGTAPSKLRNDFADMGIVAYATFFDGLMTSDQRMSELFYETSTILKRIFNAEVPYLEK